MKMTVGEISQLLNAEIEGDSAIEIVGPGSIEEGAQGQIGFYANPKYEQYLYSTNCSALLVQKDIQLLKPIAPVLIKVENVNESVGLLLQQFSSDIHKPKEISKQSTISKTSQLGEGVKVGDFSIIGEEVTIGNNTTIFGQVYIANNVTIGDNCIIYPGVKIYHYTKIGNNCVVHSNAVIGSDGFGFSQNNEGLYHKIPQTGNVHIEDDVEIGACTIIDRATMGHTIIKKGVKLDNLIQIGHNAEVGENTVIAAQSGVSGSTKLGKNCIVGGQVGFVGHIKVADGSMFQAKTGIAGNIKEENKKYYGYPAIGYQNYLKSYAYFRKFPEIVDKIRTLEKEIDILRTSLNKE